jgi:small-conductance mechanosensitive channel
MLDDFRNVWDTALFTAPGDQVVTIGQIVLVVFLLVFGYLGSRFLGYLLAKRLTAAKVRPDVIYVFKRIVFFGILIVVVITALGLLGIPLTAFAFATGALAIGIGFGAQNIINNFISGWILMAERPIRIDDFIELDDATGVVEQVGTRSTRIRRSDGVHMLVPNSLLLERTVVNWTLVDEEIRTSVRVGVAYGSPVKKVAELILQAVTEQPESKARPAPSIVFEDFGDNALIFDAYFWCDVGGEKALREIRSAVRFRISALFEVNDIVIAFPQRDVHLDAGKPLEIRLLERGENND